MIKQNHTCTTSFVLAFEFDRQKNNELLKNRAEFSPEQIGIHNKDEVEQAIIDELGVKPSFHRHYFEIGRNTDYDVYVSDMCRATLKDLFGKEERIAELTKKYGLSTILSIVPYIAADSAEPKQCLSLDDDIIAFLHKSGASMDLDYYVV